MEYLTEVEALEETVEALAAEVRKLRKQNETLYQIIGGLRRQNGDLLRKVCDKLAEEITVVRPAMITCGPALCQADGYAG